MALQCFAPSMYFQHCHFLAQPQTGAFHFAPCSVGGAWQISWSNSTWQCANKGHLCALECLAWNWTQRHFALLLVVKMQPVHMELVNPLRMWREECAGVVQVCLWAVSLRPCWKWRIASLTMECRWGVPACARNPRHIPVTASDTVETASSSLTASLTDSPVNTPLILDHLDIEIVLELPHASSYCLLLRCPSSRSRTESPWSVDAELAHFGRIAGPGEQRTSAAEAMHNGGLHIGNCATPQRIEDIGDFELAKMIISWQVGWAPFLGQHRSFAVSQGRKFSTLDSIWFIFCTYLRYLKISLCINVSHYLVWWFVCRKDLAGSSVDNCFITL